MPMFLESEFDGKTVPALSPPPDGQQSPRSKNSGAIVRHSSPGCAVWQVTCGICGHVKVYGGVVARVRLWMEPMGWAPLEVWYNHDLREGLVQGCHWYSSRLAAGKPSINNLREPKFLSGASPTIG